MPEQVPPANKYEDIVNLQEAEPAQLVYEWKKNVTKVLYVAGVSASVNDTLIRNRRYMLAAPSEPSLASSSAAEIANYRVH